MPGSTGMVKAPRWRRAVGASVDALPVTLIAIIQLYRVQLRPLRTTRALELEASAARPVVRQLVATRAAQLAYAALPLVTIGATPGQLAAGIRVVDSTSGAKPSVSQAVRRWAADAGPSLVYGAVIHSSRRRRGDRLGSAMAELEAAKASAPQGDAVDDNGEMITPQRRDGTPWPRLAGLGVLTYYLVFGRRARDRFSHTTVVLARSRSGLLS